MTEPEFKEAFQRHKDVIYRFAYRMTGSDAVAEDVLQDSFLTLWRKPSAYISDRGTLQAFLLGVARNLVLKRWRDERAHEALDDECMACEPFDAVSRERAEIVESAVRMLPPLQRETLIFAEYEGMSLPRATGTELAAVKSRLHRARGNLRRITGGN